LLLPLLQPRMTQRGGQGGSIVVVVSASPLPPSKYPRAET
jgi:hypothetical protein